MQFLKQLFKRKKKTDIFNRFELIAQVGQGSMSKVWKARDSKTGRTVALKQLDKQKTERFESRFLGLNKPSEGEIAFQLRHPNVVSTYEFGYTLTGEQFLVMEFLEGFSLSYLISSDNEMLRTNQLRIVIELGQALEYLHKNRWIHRDICPRNIVLDDENRVKLIDFGLTIPDTDPFHRPGNRTGTADYMAPELIRRQKTDQQVDVFAYAVTCFEIYTKRLPWDSGSASLETALQHMNSPPKDIRKLLPEVDEQVADTVMKGIEMYPENRWSSISEMLKNFRDAMAREELNQQGTKSS